MTKPRGKKVLIIAVAVLVVAGLITLFIHILNSPVNGSIALSRSGSVKQTAISDTTNYSSLGNDYFNLQYPGELDPDYPPTKPANSLTYDYLDLKDSSGQKVTESLEVYVKPLPVGGVAVDSDYQSYSSQPKLYKLSQQYVRGELVDIATRDSGQKERGAMWVHGNLLLIVKFKTGSGDIDTTFKAILGSIQWLKVGV